MWGRTVIAGKFNKLDLLIDKMGFLLQDLNLNTKFYENMFSIDVISSLTQDFHKWTTSFESGHAHCCK